jgi:thiopurine S-methyltransferase
MDAAFWHEKWAKGETAFDQATPNPLLVDHLSKLDLPAGKRIFVPLCGKTIDIVWLLEQGYQVIGIELNEPAVIGLFEALKLTPKIENVDALIRYRAKDIDIYVGDFFDVTAAHIGVIDAIYDRAALVALPPSMRAQYTQHLVEICHHAPQLLIVFEYDQTLMEGPPFSVLAPEVKQHYSEIYDLQVVEPLEVKGGLKGKVEATEMAWVLKANE